MTGQDPRGTRYELAGDGPGVVLVHGLGLNHGMWQWVMPSLAARHRVLSYDLAGHGASAALPAACSIDDFVAQLTALVDFVGMARFALVGFSLGGMIAQAFTLAHPRRVAGLAVLHSAFDRSDAEREAILVRVRLAEAQGPAATVDAALQRWFTPGFAAAHPEVLDQVRRWVVANDPRSFAAAYRVLAEADADLPGLIGAIRCPALVVTGGEDHGNSPDMARRMAAHLGDASCRILPGLRHMALAEDPGAVLAELLPFLERTAVR